MNRKTVLGAVLALAAAPALALVQPMRMNFQGKLITPGTNNPQAGPVSLTFNLYNVPTGGSSLYTETQNNVPLTNGVFSVEIGTQTALSREIFLGASVYLGVTVVGDAAGEMVPRQNLVMSAYAFTANQLSDQNEVRLIAGPTYSTFTSAGNFTVPGGIVGSSGSFTNGVTASSFTALNVAGAGFLTTSSSTASAFFGDGSHLTGIPSTTSVMGNFVAVTGGAMTGPLSMLSGSTITISGSAFSVGTSSFNVTGGSATVAYSLTAGSFTGGPINTADVNLSTVTTAFAAKASSGTNADLFNLIGAGNGVVISTNEVHTASVTFQANAFSVGGSSFTVAGGSATVAYSLTAGSFIGPIATADVNLSTVTTAFTTKASSGTNADLASLNGVGNSITISTSMTVSSTMTVLGNVFSVGGSSFTVAGGSATVAYSMTATTFFGDGGNLANVVDSNGDTMTGQLTISGASETVTGAVGIGGVGLANGTLVVLSTSAVAANPIISGRNNGGIELFRMQQDGTLTHGAPGAVSTFTNTGDLRIPFDLYAGSATFTSGVTAASGTVTGAMSIGGVGLANGTLVVQSTSAVAANPIISGRNNGGVELLRIQQDATFTHGTPGLTSTFTNTGDLRIPYGFYAGSATFTSATSSWTVASSSGILMSTGVFQIGGNTARNISDNTQFAATSFSSNVLIAGNLDAANFDWVFVASNTLTVAAATLVVNIPGTTFPPGGVFSFYRYLVYVPGMAAAGRWELQVNADAASDYAWSETENGTNATGNTVAFIRMDTTSNNYNGSCVIESSAVGNQNKYFTFLCTRGTTLATAPLATTGGGTWAPASPVAITSLTLLNSGGSNFNIGTTIRVFGVQ